MIPGQEVNKDVYAVNTGSIAAFVKENVSAKLTYTYEDLVDNFDPTCVELGEKVVTSIDGATTEEAGGFLAWTNAIDSTTGERYDVGSVNSAREQENPAVAGRWTPLAKGDYIFRRAIKTTTAGNTTTSTYTYAGYHYEDGKYYKIVIGTDNYPTVDNTTNKQVYDIYADQTALGVAVDPDDGTILADPAISYVVENKVENVTPTMVLKTNNANNEQDYLQVIYSENEGTQAQLDDNQRTLEEAIAALEAGKIADSAASTDLAQKEVALRNAEGAYNSAKSRYDQTAADYKYAKALTDATNELVESAKKKGEADAAVKKALDQFNKAAKDLREEAQAQQDILDADGLWGAWTSTATNQATNITPTNDGLIPTNVRTYIEGNGAPNNAYTSQSDLTNAQNNLHAMDTLWGTTSDTAASNTITGYYNTINEAYGKLAGLNGGTDVANSSAVATDSTTAKVKEYYDTIEENMTKLMNALNNYKTLYAGFVDAVVAAVDPAPANVKEELLTGLNTGNTTLASRLDDVVSDIKDLLEDGATHNVKTVLKGLVDDYKTTYDALVEAEGVAATESTNWSTAITRYNNKVSAAKTAYTGTNGVGAEQALPNDYAYLQGTGNSGRTLKDYGADTTNSYVQGTFTATLNADEYSVDYSAVETQDKSKSNNAADPEIKTNAAYTDYVTVDDTPDVNGDYSVTKKLVRKVKSEADFTQIEANYSDSETPTDATVPQKLSDLKTKMDNKYNAVYGEGGTTAEPVAGSALANYNEAVTTKNATAAAIDAAGPLQAAVTAATNALNNAATAATINIKVYLDENWDDNWTIDPADATAQGSKDVDFYLNKILEAGETSERLIDSVKLDDSMSARDYKDLTFDLNVGLDSIQVTYDANQRDYTAEAVNAADGIFKMDVTNAAPLTSETALTWAVVTDAVGTTYSADVVGVPVTVTKVDPVTVGTESYEYN